jgi:hypothetical protein
MFVNRIDAGDLEVSATGHFDSDDPEGGLRKGHGNASMQGEVMPEHSQCMEMQPRYLKGFSANKSWLGRDWEPTIRSEDISDAERLYKYERDEAAALPTTNEKRQEAGPRYPATTNDLVQLAGSDAERCVTPSFLNIQTSRGILAARFLKLAFKPRRALIELEQGRFGMLVSFSFI